MGFLPNFLRAKKDYIKYIRQLSKELKKVPSLNDLEQRGIYRLSVYKMFGSYNNLLELSGLKTRSITYTNKTEKELLDDYINLCNKLGRWATTRELKSIDIYENRFGSIIKVRKLVADNEKLKIDDKSIVESSKKYTNKEIEQYVKNAIKIHGHNITKAEFVSYLKKVNGPSVNTIMKRHKTTSFRKMINMYRKKARAFFLFTQNPKNPPSKAGFNRTLSTHQ